MTDQEKKDYGSHITTGGYLKVYDYKEAFQKSWDKADEADRKKHQRVAEILSQCCLTIDDIEVTAWL